MECEYVIIGGGVAGLTAAIRLTELGIFPLVIESGSYPSHKICGEFLSASCLDVLDNWGIHPEIIPTVYFSTLHERAKLSLPKSAGSLSHTILDPLLYQRTINGGATVYTNRRVLNLVSPETNLSKYYLELDSGEIVQASHLIVATGRLPGSAQEAPPMRYIGIKAHFIDVPVRDALEMFFFKGAYLGISPVSADVCNVACLAELSTVNQYHSIDIFFEHLIQQNIYLKNYLSVGKNKFDTWMTTKIPDFGVKLRQPGINTYSIGDAAGTIPPITGNGLAMAIASGLMAAEYAHRKDPQGYRQAWLKRFRSSIRWGRVFNKIMLNSYSASISTKVAKAMPFLFEKVYFNTR